MEIADWALDLADELLQRRASVWRWADVPSDDLEREAQRREWANLIAWKQYPPYVFREGMTMLVMNASAKDSPPLPGDLLRGCRLAIDEIKRDPVRARKMEDWIRARRIERAEAISDT